MGRVRTAASGYDRGQEPYQLDFPESVAVDDEGALIYQNTLADWSPNEIRNPLFDWSDDSAKRTAERSPNGSSGCVLWCWQP